MYILIVSIINGMNGVIAVAIQVFQEVGSPTLPGGGGGPTHHFAKISRKLHEIVRIWMPTEVRIPYAMDYILSTTSQVWIAKNWIYIYIWSQEVNNWSYN